MLTKHLHSFVQHYSGSALSIKKLTLLGFSLVSLPLVAALIYSAIQVNSLSNQGVQAIFSVSELTMINQDINERRLNLERYASQYVVLKDLELKNNYEIEQQLIHTLLHEKLSQFNHAELNQLSAALNRVMSKVNALIQADDINETSLEPLQQHFIELANVVQQLNMRSTELISSQANKIKAQAENVSNTMLKGLLIIPLTLAIAGLFIYLITTPLKLLIEKIQSLEQGDFDKSIVIKSSPEISEIADALEIMRLRLHALELQKSSFIRHISHELKTPLAAIREGTELLYDNSVGELNAEQVEVCQIIKSSVQRLQCHIEELLDFNIVLDSTSLQDHEKIELNSLIESVLSDHKLDIKRKALAINQTLEPIHVYSNAKQLKVVIDNIISNAIKYTEQQGEISINNTWQNEQLVLSICDQGPGIDDTIKDKIFDAFYQGPAPKDSTVKGSGLGLTIVKELLMRINGDIRINDSEHNLPGTIVTITLPRAEKSNHEGVSDESE